MRSYFPTFRLLPLVLGLAGFVLPSPLTATTYTPTSDNYWPPYIGVYEGSVDGVSSPYGIKKNATFTSWLNRTVVWGHDTFPADWANIQGEGWILQPWGDWVNETAGSPWAGQTPANPRQMVFSLPMLPADPNNSSLPLSGTSLANGADEADYHYAATYFVPLAKNLVKFGLGNSIIRLGWEWNGNWYAWGIRSDADAKNFAIYWANIVSAMRAVPGAQNLQFCWNASNSYSISGLTRSQTQQAYTDAYPGNAYVDYIGDDVYDSSYAKYNSGPNSGSYYYPWPAGDSAADILARQQLVWTNSITASGVFGLSYWSSFATTQGRPLAIPEWGLYTQTGSSHGGGDDTYYIQQMFDYIQNPANNVYFASYFDYNGGGDANSIISGINGATPYPNSSVLFQTLLSLPAAAPTMPPLGLILLAFMLVAVGAWSCANLPKSKSRPSP
jgi:hypothetical protein